MSTLSLVVSVGTDHHRFDRLIDWVESWIASRDFEVRLFVQHGTSRPPTIGEHAEMLSRDEMLERYSAADIVVTQVGPGSILDVASVGKLPIVVPRNPDLGEHVDGHQIRFGRFMASAGEAILAEEESVLHAALSAAAADPASLLQPPREGRVSETAKALGAVVEDVLSRPAGFIRWGRFRLPARGPAIAAPVAAPAAPVLVPVAARAASPAPVTTRTMPVPVVAGFAHAAARHEPAMLSVEATPMRPRIG